MVLGEPVDPVVAALLVGLEDEHDVARERHVRAGEPHGGGGEHRDAALVVEGAAAVEEVAADHAGERVDAPELALDADRVGVRAQHDGLADRVGAAQPGDQMRLARAWASG